MHKYKLMYNIAKYNVYISFCKIIQNKKVLTINNVYHQ